MPSAGESMNLEFVQGPSESWLTHREGHHRIFNVHQLMPVDRRSSLSSTQETARTHMNHPACETPRWQFIAGSGFKSRQDGLETSIRISRPSCQPLQMDISWIILPAAINTQNHVWDKYSKDSLEWLEFEIYKSIYVFKNKEKLFIVFQEFLYFFLTSSPDCGPTSHGRLLVWRLACPV